MQKNELHHPDLSVLEDFYSDEDSSVSIPVTTGELNCKCGGEFVTSPRCTEAAGITPWVTGLLGWAL